MFNSIARKHPQGLPFTKIVLVSCTHCGEYEADLHYQLSRGIDDTNNEPVVHTGHTCWNCFLKDA